MESEVERVKSIEAPTISLIQPSKDAMKAERKEQRKRWWREKRWNAWDKFESLMNGFDRFMSCWQIRLVGGLVFYGGCSYFLYQAILFIDKVNAHLGHCQLCK